MFLIVLRVKHAQDKRKKNFALCSRPRRVRESRRRRWSTPAARLCLRIGGKCAHNCFHAVLNATAKPHTAHNTRRSLSNVVCLLFFVLQFKNYEFQRKQQIFYLRLLKYSTIACIKLIFSYVCGLMWQISAEFLNEYVIM